MQKDLDIIRNQFLKESSFTKFFYENDVLIYLDEDYMNGDITILLCHKGGNSHAGKLKFSNRGKLRESYLLTDHDLVDILGTMKKLWKQKKYEQMTIPREEFMKLC
jgi:hypothetical protein